MTGVWPTVSVVIVSWNAKRFLSECLQSLRDTDYPGKLQTIVVDNAWNGRAYPQHGAYMLPGDRTRL